MKSLGKGRECGQASAGSFAINVYASTKMTVLSIDEFAEHPMAELGDEGTAAVGPGTIPSSTSVVIGIALNRTTPDFSERDRAAGV